MFQTCTMLFFINYNGTKIYFQEKRGLALGIFNWGIYFGYGLSYAFGNFVTRANITGLVSELQSKILILIIS